MYVYTNKVAYAEHIALVKGDITTDKPVPVRMHALNILEDILNDASSDKSGQLHAAMQMIGDIEHGVVVLIREPHRTALSDHLRERMGQTSAPLQTAGGGERVLRDYGVGAQILLDLGVRDMILLTNTRQHAIIGIEGYGLRIVDQKPIIGSALN
jgi:3,4-dihydroxy 2-butanone 4-phosphate synthase/GTP cyclohydrolase II